MIINTVLKTANIIIIIKTIASTKCKKWQDGSKCIFMTWCCCCLLAAVIFDVSCKWEAARQFYTREGRVGRSSPPTTRLGFAYTDQSEDSGHGQPTNQRWGRVWEKKLDRNPVFPGPPPPPTHISPPISLSCPWTQLLWPQEQEQVARVQHTI